MLLVITTNLATLRVRVSWRARLLAARPKSGDGGGSDGPGNGKREFPPSLSLSLSTVAAVAAAIGLATTGGGGRTDRQIGRPFGRSLGGGGGGGGEKGRTDQTRSDRSDDARWRHNNFKYSYHILPNFRTRWIRQYF